MENYRFVGPIFSNIELKIPNTIIQVRFYGLMKLQISKKSSFIKIYFIYKLHFIHQI